MKIDLAPNILLISFQNNIKKILITFAALVLVGCGPSVPDISIHQAAEEGNFEAVKQHLAAGTDVNAKNEDDYGLTPLYYATGEGHKEIAELLIAEGADVNMKDDNGGTPLHYAASFGHKEASELLIANGADLNAIVVDGQTPLLMAVAKGHKEIIELLIAKGADINAKNAFNKTPLDAASDFKHTEILYGNSSISPNTSLTIFEDIKQ